MPEHDGPHVLFAFAPTLDTHDRFFNCYPSSLLHAVAPLVDVIDSGRLDGSYCHRIYHPKVLTAQALELWRTMLVREQPTHVAVSSTYDSWHVALGLSRMVREIVPEAVIIHGGPHLDEVLEPFVLSRTPQLDPLNDEDRGLIDFSVAGDGEHALLWLVTTTANSADGTQAVKEAERRREQIAAIPGTGHIVFFSRGERHTLKFRNLMPLDSLPFVPRHLLPVEDMYDFDCFRDEDGARKPAVTMITHRGCRARCNFCSEGLPYQSRSHGHVLAEAEQLRASGVRSVFFDDSTIQDDRHFLDLLRGFHSLGLETGALTRFDQIQDRNQLERMRDLGLTYFYASVEQYSDASLDLMHKKLCTEQINTGVENCQKVGVRLGVSLLFGLPYETASSVDATLGYAQRLRDRELVEYISMSLFAYHPKTPLGQMHRGLLRDFDFNHAPPNLRHPYTGFEEGCWYHPEHVTDAYADRILSEAMARFGDRLVREIDKHRGDTPTAAKG